MARNAQMLARDLNRKICNLGYPAETMRAPCVSAAVKRCITGNEKPYDIKGLHLVWPFNGQTPQKRSVILKLRLETTSISVFDLAPQYPSSTELDSD